MQIYLDGVKQIRQELEVHLHHCWCLLQSSCCHC